MKVYKVRYAIDRIIPDTSGDQYQYLMLNMQHLKPEEYGIYKAKRFTFAGVPIKEWSPPLMHLQYPLRPAPDIWYLANSGAFGVGRRVFEFENFEQILLEAGQLLPLPFKGQELTICNILESAECIDEDRSEWILHPTDGKRLRPRRPFFISSEIPASTLFKIPQLPMDIFTWEENREPTDEFKACVEANGLTGLIFEPVWSEEEGIIPYKRI